MKNTKLYRTLQCFDNYQLNRLEKFFNSPYFNVNKQLIQLYDDYKNLVKEEAPEQSKEQLWKKLYPKKAWNSVRFRKLCNDALKLVEEFIAIENLKEEKLKLQNHLLEGIKKHNIHPLKDIVISQTETLIERTVVKDTFFYFDHYKFLETQHELKRDFERKKEIKKDSIYARDITRVLDIFYAAEKLKFNFAYLYNFRISDKAETLYFIDEIEKQVNNLKIFGGYPIVILYYLVNKTFENNATKYYFQLKTSFEKFGFSFNDQIKKEIAQALFNFCVRNLNSKEHNFEWELFELYKAYVHQDFMLDNGFLNPAVFRNVVRGALRVGEIVWAEDFIETQAIKLNPKYRENAISFNLARVHWNKKEYDKVIERLQNVEYEDVMYNLNSKSMLLVVYYELNQTEALFALAESFATFLRRSNYISSSRKERFMNLIRFTKKLAKLNKGDDKKLQKIKQELLNTSKVKKPWLMEKIKELEDKKVLV